MPTIHAAVSSKILNKVDRMFSNRMTQIFIELIQNARRAGATLITVATLDSPDGTVISFEDNGVGIDDFSKLLHLGDGNWDAETDRKEDPAGMGFFSLIHTGVRVLSNGMFAEITRESFLGKTAVEVQSTSLGPSQGTRLVFTRPAEKAHQVDSDLRAVSKYGLIDVVLNGVPVEREDFMAKSLYTKVMNGVRLGVFEGSPRYEMRCNFHGSVISHKCSKENFGLADVILPTVKDPYSLGDLHIEWDVLETTSLHLKLPDRTEIVQDDAYKFFARESRVVLYEYLATLPAHTLSYIDFVEAKSLGIDLMEASPFLKDFYVNSRDSMRCESEPFSQRILEGRKIVDLTTVALVDVETDGDASPAFTFETGFAYSENLPLRPIAQCYRFSGYSWYKALPVYRNFDLSIMADGEEVKSGQLLELVDSINLTFELKWPGSDEPKVFSWDLPFAGYPDDDDHQNCFLFVTEDSNWVNECKANAAPFCLESAAEHIGFDPGDDVESDSYDTQHDYFTERVEREIVRVLGGNIGQARLELNKVVSNYELRDALNAAGINEVWLVKKDKDWTFDIVEGSQV